MHIVRYWKVFWTQLHCGIQIRMVAGFAEVIESEATLVAEACNHPNLLVLQFRFELNRVAA